MKPYSQLTAMLAITKGSLRAIFRSPSAVIFSFVFPLIFILVFGFIGGGGITVNVALKNASDTNNVLIKNGLQKNPSIRLVTNLTEADARKEVGKGNIAALISIDSIQAGNGAYQYLFKTTTSSASIDRFPIFRSQLSEVIRQGDERNFPNRPTVAKIEMQPEIPGREYKTIDFILPGQLGFSLLSAGVFGVAFMFFSLRNTLVLKRFFATPINRTYIVLGEGLSRVLFSLITAVVIIGFGRFFFGFTLIHGFETFLEMMVLSFMGLIVFMGFGFIVSGLAKSDSTIPPFANLITLPQFLLSGTFFSIDAFPHWLQIIARLLPLTYLNQAMRSVAFEGMHFWNVTTEISHTQVPVVFILLLWAVIVYAVAIKVFRWE
ncbi:MAG: ABC transporter permease [Chitinophagaceae bacterium]|nr:ABC transporter permease [Chitinophagaceae bacterium]